MKISIRTSINQTSSLNIQVSLFSVTGFNYIHNRVIHRLYKIYYIPVIIYDILLFPTSEEKKNQLKYISNEVVRRRVTTQVQFTCLERSRRQILRRKFSARTPKGTRSVKISTKGICISVWWDAKAFPGSQKLILYRRTNIALKLVLEFLTRLTTHGISARIFR